MTSAWRNNVQIKVWSGTNTYEKTGDLNVKLIAGQSWSFGGVTVTVQSLNPSQTPPNALLTIRRSCSSNTDCDDGNFCNGAETCSAGICVAGVSPCDVAQCDETNNICVQCLTNADCSDGVFCNGEETCVSGVCTAGAGDPCSGVTPVAQCDETNDICVQCLTNADCSDGVFCNGEETCASGVCTAGAGDPCSGPSPEVCNEATDSCNVVECTTDAHCVDDGLFCTGVPTCISNRCTSQGPCGGAQPKCDETKDICVQCLTSADCNDGLYCTGSETCTAGSCQSSGNPCTGSTLCNEASDTCIACSGWKVACTSSAQCCSRNCVGRKCTKP